MTIAFGHPTDLTTLLDAIEAQLLASTAVASVGQIFPVLKDIKEIGQFPPDDRFLVITPQRFPANQAVVAGGGTYQDASTGALKFDAGLAVTMYHQFSTDQAFQDREWLKNTTSGAWQAWKKVLKSLHLFTPQDGSSNYITCEPMRLLGFDFNPREPTTLGWGKIRGEFEMVYIQDMS